MSAGTTIGELAVKLGMDSSGFTQGLKNAEGQAKSSSSVIQSALGIMGGLLGANVISAGFQALRQGFADVTSIAKQDEQVQAQTAAAIKSTGDASGLSATQVEDYATQLSKVTPYSRDAIQQGENMLLTFTGIGKQTFPQATQAVLDMATAFKSSGKQMDISEIAIMVGKALQDPISGVTNLRRVGVQLSDQQQQQVKDFMAVGDAADAQKVIIQELGREFGGSALAQGQTFAGQQEIIGEQITQTKEKIGAALLPVLGTLATSALPGVNAALGMVPGIIQRITPGLEMLGQLFGDVATAASTWLGKVLGVAPQVASAVESVGGGLVAADTNVASAGQQAAANLASLTAQGKQADDQIKQIDASTAGLSAQEKALQTRVGDVGAAYDAQSQAVQSQQQSIQRQIDATTAKFDAQTQALQDQQAALEQQSQQITDSYTAQLDPLQKQLDALKQAVTVEQQRSDLENRLQDTQLQEAQLAAEGDPKKRAALATQMALLKAKEDQHSLEQQIADTEKQIAADKKGTDVEGLQLKLQELQLQQQQAALADPKKLAEIAGQQELLKAQQQKTALTEQEQKTKNDIAAIPLQQKVDALKAAEQAALDPLNAQLKSIKDQETAVQHERDVALRPLQADLKQLQYQEQDITAAKQAALAPMQAQLRNLQDQGAALDAQKAKWQDVKQSAQDQADALNVAPPASAAAPAASPGAMTMGPLDRIKGLGKESGGQIARTLLSGLGDFIKNHLGETIGAAIGFVAFGPIGAVIGVGLGHVLSEEFKSHHGDLAAMFSDMADKAKPVIEAIGQKLIVWGRAFVTWIGPQIGPLLLELGKLYLELEKWVLTVALPKIVEKLGEWGLEFVKWVAPKIPPLLVELGKLVEKLNVWIVTVALPAIVEKLGKWGEQFIAWVGPQIPPLLAALGDLLVQLGQWVLFTALPDLIVKLGEWAAAFVGWSLGLGGKAVEGLGDLSISISKWIVETALPTIVKDVGKWGMAFLGWVGDILPKIPGELFKIVVAIQTYIGNTLGPAVGTAAEDIGKALLHGILDGLGSLKDWFIGKLGDFIKGAIPDPIKKVLDIKSPSGLMRREVGAFLLPGVLAGAEDTRPEFVRRMAALVMPPRPGAGGLPLNRATAAAGATGRAGSGENHYHLYLTRGGDAIETIVTDAVSGRTLRTY